MEYVLNQEYRIIPNWGQEKFIIVLNDYYEAKWVEIPFVNLEGWPQLSSKENVEKEISEVVKSTFGKEKVIARYSSKQVENKIKDIALRNLLNFE